MRKNFTLSKFNEHKTATIEVIAGWQAVAEADEAFIHENLQVSTRDIAGLEEGGIS